MRLRLDFANGVISGGGADVVGPFTISGAYGAETADFTKKYPRHSVKYEGKWDGQVLFGTWVIRSIRDRGEFEIWPEDEELQLEVLAQEESRETVGV
jgi:hypothetical protein